MFTVFLASLHSLHEALVQGNLAEMYRCADAVEEAFQREVPDVFKDFESVRSRFLYAREMTAFLKTIGEESQARILRNRIIAHYQAVRKSTDYSVEQKHILKELLKEVRNSAVPEKQEISMPRELSERIRFVSRAYRWFEEVHGMLPSECIDYLKPYRLESLLYSLPLNLPKLDVVEEMTRFCYETGGSLAPRYMQRHYSIEGRPARHLYVIGNGFDRYHGAQSGYMHFRRYLYRQAPVIVGYFDLFFGPRSLGRSFSTPAGWWWCTQPYEYRHDTYGLRYPISTWTRTNLWRDFENNLCELNREKVFDLVDMQLPRVDQGEPGFKYSEFFAPLDEISHAVRACTFEMKYHFHRWVNTLHYAKGFRRRMLPLDRDALFLNFNYTLFLESEYGIPASRICYIHGSRKDKFGSLVLGHHAADQESFDRWYHKNRNRRRYRDVQKDAKGRYFRNDKLAYLAFFNKDRESANWRLPIRYYAVNEAEERLERYYSDNYKNTARIIDSHLGFFDSLSEVDKVTVIGCSLGTVDMDYYRQLRASVRDDTLWEFSSHTDADRNRIRSFCKELKISDTHVRVFDL